MRALARRAFLRFMPLAAAAGPMAARAVVNDQMARHTGGALGSALAEAPTPPLSIDYPPEFQALEALMQTRHERAQTTIAYRDGHFDPHIAALRSLPHATKVRMQIAQDEAFKAANRSLSERIQEWRAKLWGTPANVGAQIARRSMLK